MRVILVGRFRRETSKSSVDRIRTICYTLVTIKKGETQNEKNNRKNKDFF